MSAEFDEIVENFALLEEWEDRYRYLIELGRDLSPLAPEQLTAENKVRGCSSQVWLVAELIDGRLRLKGESDAHIVRGLVALLIRLYDGQDPAAALMIDARAQLDRLGLATHLSPTRANGLTAMVTRLRELAAHALQAKAEA